MDEPSILVVGGGLIGVGCAYQLQKAGCEVQLISDTPIGSMQSAGASRIFRLSHDDPAHTQAAREALSGWRRWEAELGVELLSNGGLLISGPVTDRLAHLNPEEYQMESGPIHPLSNLNQRWAQEKSGAAGYIERAITGLSQKLKIIEGRVREVHTGGLTLEDGRRLSADRVVVCAGPQTYALLGIEQPELFSYLRFSFPIRSPQASPLPCWMQRDPSICSPFYALPDSDGFYALGLSETVHASIDPEEHLTEHARRTSEIVEELLPGLLANPMRPLRCIYPSNPNSEQQGKFTHDGFQILDEDGAIGVAGPNLFKFAPYIADCVTGKLRSQLT